jgi:hypothetical protein
LVASRSSTCRSLRSSAGAEDAGAGVGDDDVDVAELGERRVDDVGQGGGVPDVQLPGPQPLAERAPEVVQLFRVA